MIHTYCKRIYYGETDKMGVAYYANYLVYFEEARTEFFRDAGYPYTDVEKMGIYLPVIEASCRYFSPTTYDDVIEVSTWISLFKGVRIGFCYEVRKKGEDTIVASGDTLHAFINKYRKPARIPDELKNVIRTLVREKEE